MVYTPSNWYWSGIPVGQSGVIIYSSASGGIVSDIPAGSGSTIWPKDETGAVTTAALDAVLVAAGLPPTGLTPPTQAQLLSAANAKLTTLMAVARTYALGGSPAVSVKSDAMQGTGSDLAGINAWGAANPTATTTWVDDFGVSTMITGAQGVTLAAAVIAYGQSVYDVLGTASSGIAAGTITTVAQINALAWPT
jgi:hypothetical protein